MLTRRRFLGYTALAPAALRSTLCAGLPFQGSATDQPARKSPRAHRPCISARSSLTATSMPWTASSITVAVWARASLMDNGICRVRGKVE